MNNELPEPANNHEVEKNTSLREIYPLDEGAEEFPGYVPTRYELYILAKHWIEEKLDADSFYFFFNQTGNWRDGIVAKRRIARIQDVIGEETVNIAEAEVKSELTAGSCSSLWRMFFNGEEPPRDECGMPIVPEEEIP